MKSFFGKDFRSLPADAILTFYSGKDGHRIDRDITLYAVPHLKETKDCEENRFGINLSAKDMFPITR
jgi:hypothetical protein